MVLLEWALYSVAPEPVRKSINAGVSWIAKSIRKTSEYMIDCLWNCRWFWLLDIKRNTNQELLEALDTYDGLVKAD